MKLYNHTGFGLDGFATATAATFATVGMASVSSVAGVATVAVADRHIAKLRSWNKHAD